MSDLLSLPATELRQRIGTKEISPVELLEACIERIIALNPATNAITGTDVAEARRVAKTAEQAVRRGEPLGLLHGLPTGIKDLHETGGLLTTYGSPLHANDVPEFDCAMVANVRAEGAVILCKTNVPEFGAGANSRNPVWGATGNPFNPALNPGGSSGGSAVALATDMLPVCTGSDTGGSLRIPAAICGVVGFRPSPGVVPMDKRPHGWSAISVLGPMGKTVADTRLLLAAQAAMDDREPLGFPVPREQILAPRPADLGSLRVAWTEDFGQAPVGSEIRQAMREKMAAMSHLFAACDHVAIDMGEADRCFDVVRAQGFVARYQSQYETDPSLLGPNIRANYEIGAKMTLSDAAWAAGEQTRLFRRFQTLYRDYDLVLSPTVPVTPFPWTQLYLEELEGVKLRNYYHWLALTYDVTLVTNPAISLPCGTDPMGMPFGLQVTGRFRGDLDLLDAAQSLESAFNRIPGLTRPRPDLAKLATPHPALAAFATHRSTHAHARPIAEQAA
ncbi:MAG: amidase [Alphaproteobacteria bacterium]|nr:amidase [Alphaproteobacteria bacterium]